MSADTSLSVLYVKASNACVVTTLFNGFPLMKERHLFAAQEWTELIDLHNVTAGNRVELSWRGDDVEAVAPSLECFARIYSEGGAVTPENGNAIPLETSSAIATKTVNDAYRFVPAGPIGSAAFDFQMQGHDFKSVYYGAEFISEEESLRSARALLGWAKEGAVSKLLAAHKGLFDDLATINGVQASDIKEHFRSIMQNVLVDPGIEEDSIEATSYCDGRLFEVGFGQEPLLRSFSDDYEASLDVFLGKRNGRITVLR